MQEKSIDGALLALRKNLFRGGGDGLEHVEALLALRAVATPAVLPAKKPDAARRGHMRRLVILGLRESGQTMPELTKFIARNRPELDWNMAFQRTGQCLTRLKRSHRVTRIGRTWTLTGL